MTRFCSLLDHTMAFPHLTEIRKTAPRLPRRKNVSQMFGLCFHYTPEIPIFGVGEVARVVLFRNSARKSTNELHQVRSSFWFFCVCSFQNF